jgi:hypothetical protein
MDVEQKRLMRLRRKLLRLIDAAKVSGGLRGHKALDYLSEDPDEVWEASEVRALAIDLSNAGLITIEDLRKTHRQPEALEWEQYQVTAKGTALLAGAIEKNPLVEDERI